jgi:hypothetical protein
MFWRATLAIAALYYVTVPPAERAATESQLRASAAGLPAQVVSLCQANPAACASLVQQASSGLTGGITTLATVPPLASPAASAAASVPASASVPAPAAAPASPATPPASAYAVPPRQLVEHAPLPPRRPALLRSQNGA